MLQGSLSTEEIEEYETIYKALCTHFNTCYVRDGVVEIDL